MGLPKRKPVFSVCTLKLADVYDRVTFKQPPVLDDE